MKSDRKPWGRTRTDNCKQNPELDWNQEQNPESDWNQERARTETSLEQTEILPPDYCNCATERHFAVHILIPSEQVVLIEYFSDSPHWRLEQNITADLCPF